MGTGTEARETHPAESVIHHNLYTSLSTAERVAGTLARDDILNGSHPVSFDKACEFAGIQAQIQFGPHVEHKHKPGFLDLKEFLPKEYIKQRGSEKKIFQEHKNCGEMTEIEAKVKYV
ncbi:talin-2-like protein, partial [Lates japonicus]